VKLYRPNPCLSQPLGGNVVAPMGIFIIFGWGVG
jgi:hypothetical protein